MPRDKDQTGDSRPSEDTETDEEVRRLLDAGSTGKAHELLVRRYRPNLQRYLRKRSPAKAHPGELENAVWESVFKALPEFDRDGPLIGLILQIARRRAADAFGAPSFDALPEDLSVRGELFPGRGGSPPSPSSHLRRKERIEAVRRALLPLSESDREILRLHYVDGLAPRTIAVVLGEGASPHAIRQRLSVAKKRFAREYLSGPMP